MTQQVSIIDKNINYDRLPSSIVKWGISNLPFLQNEGLVNRRLNILIAGCGTGRNAHYLSTLGHDIIGFDIAQENIGLAGQRYSERPVQTAFHFFAHDLNHGLPFEKSSFDLVVDVFVYNEQMSAESRKAYLCEISRCLKNGGALLLGVHSNDDEYFMTCNALENSTPKVISDPISKKNVLCYSEEDLITETEDNFQISMKWLQTKYQDFGTQKYLRKYLITLLRKHEK